MSLPRSGGNIRKRPQYPRSRMRVPTSYLRRPSTTLIGGRPSIGNDSCTRGVAQELRKLSARYEHVFDSAPNFANTLDVLRCWTLPIIRKEGFELSELRGCSGSLFGAYHGESASESAMAAL